VSVRREPIAQSDPGKLGVIEDRSRAVTNSERQCALETRPVCSAR
jgi:hypothetical protein